MGFWTRIVSKIKSTSKKVVSVIQPKIKPTQQMWFECELDKEPAKIKEIENVINRILQNKEKYKKVSDAVQVPVWVIAGIHFRESSLNFRANMVNGQPLGQVTTIVPKGLGPWRTWEQAAVDAFKRRKYDPSWSVAQWLDFCEAYNGMGYRRRGLTSPYVWGYTNQSAELGKFVRDGVFDPNHEVSRPGIAALLEYAVQNKIEEISGSIV
jgi:lysozyme family protein